ncbi:hypothetical protein LX15_001249 [Streptoalloteichus tenebrarius]|uniref:Integral membrane protein n=1 Tax=Streptoalloteichus tenebrarius (strain ATCC 17920 / DSM 40477 / JCM 4838 / CBS 697.72 / NBRC 16177 / NCIMB 11028 / NRRL B-12390 / A12253. 1 / ISP 5477) TaxID=1933 RepID=A0ABT1HPY2_STRSD|nr:hypothetical protein [Streptoalloteichus tenebrarius]MCP2257564.1 hypothetical protein [Streptoalloteichus tenebrarius]BFE98518.1 hypothetical protein GCM10020241_01940 [Streptoalloteichus tenebrarius]
MPRAHHPSDDEEPSWPHSFDGVVGRLEHLPKAADVPAWHPEASTPASPAPPRPRVRDLRVSIRLGTLMVLAVLSAAVTVVQHAMGDEPWDLMGVLVSWVGLVLLGVLVPVAAMFVLAGFFLAARRRSR